MLMTRRWDDGLETAVLDVRGLKSPWPLHWTRQRMEALAPGQPLRIVSTEPRSVVEIRELTSADGTFELVRQEEEFDDRGRHTFTCIVQRRS